MDRGVGRRVAIGDVVVSSLASIRARTERLALSVATIDDEPALTGRLLLGRYRLERPIGKGGMSVVYAARHVLLGGPVAVKVLRSRFVDDEEAVARFLREAKASARVHHPHVVQVLDFGVTDGGLVFMVMEYLDGENLASTLAREGAMPWPRVRAIALQLCDALQAAHDARVVHRDVTLGNCLRIHREGTTDYVKLLDFGIAKVPLTGDDRRFRLTSEVQVFGTPAFMAPEQARRAADADPRTDIYSMGCLLYALTTGHLPFEGKSLDQVIAQQMYEPAPPPNRWIPTIAPAVAALLLRALEKNPDRRFQSMAELAGAIRAIGPDGRATAPDRSPWTRALARWSRLQARLGIGAVFVLFVLGGVCR